MGTLASLGEFELAPPRDDLLAELHEGLYDITQAHQFRATTADSQHVDAEALLRRGVTIKLIENDFGCRVALQFHDDTNAFAVRFVAQV